jgi:biopolymer transport protein TolQ
MTDKFFAIAQFGHEITLWLLMALSIFSLAFILERFFSLSKVRADSTRIRLRVREMLQSNALGELEELAKDRSSLEGRALAYALRHVKDRGNEGLEEIFMSYQQVERPFLEKHLNFLATVGSNAPFIGLLGTVFGVMDAFKELAHSQPDQPAVMLGISKALIATAFGLMVAIPAVISYNYFQRQVRGIMGSLESVKDLCLAYALSRGK